MTATCTIERDDREYEVEVEFDYSPEEPMVMYCPDGSGDPGCAEYADINKVMFYGFDLLALDLLTDKDLSAIDEQCCNYAREDHYYGF